MQESSLHTSLKDWYTRPGDGQEVYIDGYLIDVARADVLIEIQTRNFTALKAKLTDLLQRHHIRLVHPIALQKWILYLPPKGNEPRSRRKSPRRGRLEHIFLELIRLPHLAAHPNFNLEVLLIHEEETRRDDGKGSWRRRGQSIVDRRLVEIVESHLFSCSQDYGRLLPSDLHQPFTNQELARALSISINLATKMTYCLRIMEVLEFVGKRGRAFLYAYDTKF